MSGSADEPAGVKELEDAIVPNSLSMTVGHDLRYEDMTSAELEARLRAFVNSGGVTVAHNGTVTWIYRPGTDDEGNPVDDGAPITLEHLPE